MYVNCILLASLKISKSYAVIIGRYYDKNERNSHCGKKIYILRIIFTSSDFYYFIFLNSEMCLAQKTSKAAQYKKHYGFFEY